MAGAAALLVTAGYLGFEEIKSELIASARDMGPLGKDDNWGHGFIDIGAALAAPEVEIAGPSSITTSGTSTWTASVSGGANHAYEWYRKTDYYYPRDAPTCHEETAWQLVSTTASYSAYVWPGVKDFELMLTVHANGGYIDTDVRKVYGDGSFPCET